MKTNFPTTDPTLNAILHEFTQRAQVILGSNLIALYLQGSFGVGDWDIYSDVDFLAAVEQDLSEREVSELNAMHAHIYDLGPEWARHLEGSYFPKELLKRGDPARTPLYYLDNTARSMIRSDHDNTLVVRWVVREHGIPLVGPDPRELIDPVPAADLKQEVRATMSEWAEEIFKGSYNINNRWAQPFAVISYCRMLQTLHTGTIESKIAGVRWGMGALDSRWTDLIQRAWEDRPDPNTKYRQKADPQDVQSTVEFIHYALSEGGKI